MWWFRWHSRRFLRSVMQPMNPETAVKWEKRMRLVYILVAFNAMLVGCKYYFGNKDTMKEMGYVIEESHAHKKVRQMTPSGNMTVISMGWNKPTEVFDINVDEYKKEYDVKQKMAREEYLRKVADSQTQTH